MSQNVKRSFRTRSVIIAASTLTMISTLSACGNEDDFSSGSTPAREWPSTSEKTSSAMKADEVVKESTTKAPDFTRELRAIDEPTTMQLAMEDALPAALQGRAKVSPFEQYGMNTYYVFPANDKSDFISMTLAESIELTNAMQKVFDGDANKDPKAEIVIGVDIENTKSFILIQERSSDAISGSGLTPAERWEKFGPHNAVFAGIPVENNFNGRRSLIATYNKPHSTEECVALLRQTAAAIDQLPEETTEYYATLFTLNKCGPADTKLKITFDAKHGGKALRGVANVMSDPTMGPEFSSFTFNVLTDQIEIKYVNPPQGLPLELNERVKEVIRNG